jgi:hypothetical protein
MRFDLYTRPAIPFALAECNFVFDFRNAVAFVAREMKSFFIRCVVFALIPPRFLNKAEVALRCFFAMTTIPELLLFTSDRRFYSR